MPPRSVMLAVVLACDRPGARRVASIAADAAEQRRCHRSLEGQPDEVQAGHARDDALILVGQPSSPKIGRSIHEKSRVAGGPDDVRRIDHLAIVEHGRPSRKPTTRP